MEAFAEHAHEDLEQDGGFPRCSSTPFQPSLTTSNWFQVDISYRLGGDAVIKIGLLEAFVEDNNEDLEHLEHDSKIPRCSSAPSQLSLTTSNWF